MSKLGRTVTWAGLVAVAAVLAACGDSGNGSLRTRSPVFEDIVPCGGDETDVWTFEVSEDERVVLLADTVNGATAADLALSGSCESTGDSFEGDDEFDCEFPPPSFGCPLTQFIASGDDTCFVAVRTFINCADPSVAEYLLFVTRDGRQAALVLAQDDQVLGESSQSSSAAERRASDSDGPRKR